MDECDYFYDEIIPATGHKLEKTEKIPATCLTDGVNEYYTCSVCKKTFKDSKANDEFVDFSEITIKALGHLNPHNCEEGTNCQQLIEHNDKTFLEHIDGRCGEPAQDIYACKRAGCDYTETDYTIIEHDFEVIGSTPPSCVCYGIKTEKCKKCGDLKESIIEEPLGHAFLKEDGTTTKNPEDENVIYIVDRESNCTQNGSKHTDCIRYGTSNCIERYSIDIPANGHKWGEEEHHRTCTTADAVTHTCKVCSLTEFVDGFTDEPLGHQDLDDCRYEYEEPGCEKDGYERWYCQRVNDGVVCNTLVKEIIIKGEHDFSEITVEPTCLEDGCVKTVCSKCDFEKIEKTIDHLGHDYGAWVDDENGISHTKTCQRDFCDETVTEHKKIANHEIKETDRLKPTCTEEGYIEYTCSDCGYTYKTPLEAMGHEYGEWYVVAEPTYTADGIEQRDCIRHDDTQTRSIPMLKKLKATFIADGEVIDVVEFEANAESINEPAVPTKERYSGYEESVANAALQKAELAKSAYGALVYSVNVQNDTYTSVKFMSRASSNYQGVTTMSENAVESDTKFYTLVKDTDKLKDVFSGIATSITTSYSDFDNVTLIDTVSSVFTMTTEQEKALRKNAIEQLKVPDSAISVTRNNDGTTTVMIKDIHPVQVKYTDGKVKYEVAISFAVTANERLTATGTYDTNTADAGVSLDGGKTFDAVFTSPHVDVKEDKGAVIFNINGEPFHIVRVKQGERVKAPAYDVLSGYTFSGWNIDGDYTLDGGSASFDAVLSGSHNHSYKEVVLSKATCSKDGTVAYICVCGDSYTESIAKTGNHNFVAITGSAAADDYSTEEFLCETCGKSMNKTLRYKFEASVTSGRTNRRVEYDIDMLNVNGEYSQPDGTVTITVPISDYITNLTSLRNVVVYRVNDDGTQTALSAKYENGVLTFKTDHFCTFIFEFEYECEKDEHLDEDGNGICDRCDGSVSIPDPSKDCTHICHSSNAFIQFIWKIFRFFSMIFGVNKVCSCGVAHY